MDTRPSFDKTAIHSVELNLLDGQVDLSKVTNRVECKEE